MNYFGEYQYKGLWGCNCICYLEVQDHLVIATELDQNQGTSITNFAEHLATQVCEQFNIPKNQLVWIEHYPDNHYRSEEYDLVTFTLVNGIFKKPQWRPLTAVEKLAWLPARGMA